MAPSPTPVIVLAPKDVTFFTTPWNTDWAVASLVQLADSEYTWG